MAGLKENLRKLKISSLIQASLSSKKNSYTAIPWYLYLVYVVEGLAGAAGIGYVFYNSIWVAFILSPLIGIYVWIRRRGYIKKRKEVLLMQFKTGMEAVLVALSAGYSVENAFMEAYKELGFIYGSRAEILTLFKQIKNQLAVNRNIEDILMSFATESGQEDIMTFAEVFKAAKRTGGDIVKIIKHTTTTISEKAETAREISILISAKQMEQTIMDVVPIGIIMYLRISSPELLSVLYKGMAGRCVMSACLLVYLVAVGISLHITNIKV